MEDEVRGSKHRTKCFKEDAVTVFSTTEGMSKMKITKVSVRVGSIYLVTLTRVDSLE